MKALCCAGTLAPARVRDDGAQRVHDGKRRAGVSGRTTAQEKTQKCDACDKEGHTSRTCWKLHPHLAPQRRKPKAAAVAELTKLVADGQYTTEQVNAALACLGDAAEAAGPPPVSVDAVSAGSPEVRVPEVRAPRSPARSRRSRSRPVVPLCCQ